MLIREKKEKICCWGVVVQPITASLVHCIHSFQNQLFLSLSLQQIIEITGVYNNLKQH